MTDAAPNTPSTSLAPGPAADKATIEQMMGDPGSAYWSRGELHPDVAKLVGLPTGEAIRAHYADLVRGELAGADSPVGPAHETDIDTPRDAGGYDLQGLAIYSGEDRDIVDSFAAVALQSGIGQEKFFDAVQWALNQPVKPDAMQFHRWAAARGWGDVKIRAAIDWFAKEAKRHG